MVGVKDVALRAGVSVGTVSNVLNRPHKVSPATVHKVESAIAELDFVRNDAARQLRAGSSRAIGLAVLDMGNPFFSDLARGAEDAAAEAGYWVLVGNSSEQPERETAYLDLFEEQRMRGVLLSPVGHDTSHLERLRRHGIPAVLVDRTSGGTGYSSVAVDDIAGGEMALAHLIEQGRRRIAYVCGPLEIRQVADRLAGARQVALEHPGVTIEVLAREALTAAEGRIAGDEIVDRPPDLRPDAVFAANDLLVLGVLQALALAGGIRVPEDIALVGYDDIGFAANAAVPLSSVRQPAAMLGRTGMEILLAEAANPSLEPREVQFQPELIVRESSRLNRQR